MEQGAVLRAVVDPGLSWSDPSAGALIKAWAVHFTVYAGMDHPAPTVRRRADLPGYRADLGLDGDETHPAANWNTATSPPAAAGSRPGLGLRPIKDWIDCSTKKWPAAAFAWNSATPASW